MPEQPGVYIMRNQPGKVIYVGKAKNLKNRVRQYFQSLSGQSQKVRVMVSQIYSFEYIITNTEMEALILECNLIKRYKPKYNILLKDDKTYPYIKITTNEEFPRAFMTRKVIKDGAKYFGPYTNVSSVRDTLDFLHKTFLIKKCNNQNFSSKRRPCLNYHIKICLAPCQGWISKEEYQEIIKDVCNFLSGKEGELLKKLQDEMLMASQNMEFEKAAFLRDKIISIKNMFQEQKVVSTSLDDEDVIAYAIKGNTACIQVFFIRGGKLIGRENFIFNNLEDSIPDISDNIPDNIDSNIGVKDNNRDVMDINDINKQINEGVDEIDSFEHEDLVTSYIKQFYNLAEYIPTNILLPIDIEEKDLLSQWLGEKKGSKVYIKVPKRGEKLKLIRMVSKNAEIFLNNYTQSVKEKIDKDELDALNEISEQKVQGIEKLIELTGIKEYPHRIEAYDISNTGSTDITGSLVVFKDGQPLPAQYRKYKIKTIEGPDDYAAMQEVVFRRFRKDTKANYAQNPDLILVDGGLGHVNAINEVLMHYNLKIPVYGMVKDDRHRTRGLVSVTEEISLQEHQSLLMFITKIQDEAHRFALQYNRKVRDKRYKKSILDEIPGVGEKRKKELLRHFKSIDKIRLAKVAELEQVEGINKSIAQNIYKFFNKGK